MRGACRTRVARATCLCCRGALPPTTPERGAPPPTGAPGSPRGAQPHGGAAAASAQAASDGDGDGDEIEVPGPLSDDGDDDDDDGLVLEGNAPSHDTSSEDEGVTLELNDPNS